MQLDLWDRLKREIQAEDKREAARQVQAKLKRDREKKKKKPLRLREEALPHWAPRYLAAVASGETQEGAARQARLSCVQTAAYYRSRNLRFAEAVMEARLRAEDPEWFYWLDTLRIVRTHGLHYNLGHSFYPKRLEMALSGDRHSTRPRQVQARSPR